VQLAQDSIFKDSLATESRQTRNKKSQRPERDQNSDSNQDNRGWLEVGEVSTVVKDHLFVKCLSVLAKMWAWPTTDPFLGRRLTPNSLNYHRGYHWPLLSKVTVRRFPSKRLKRSRACPLRTSGCHF
jgi:hypothetical protein